MTERMQLTDAGKFAFYAAHPSLDERQAFNDKCERQEEGTAILGCYDGQRIYLFDVADSRLDGMEEVTAAHEMLHAVYQRLSQSEKQRIDRLIEAAYETLKDDPRLAERMAFYARTEPGERDNELHSIIGTEVMEVSAELEAHYAQYFSNRKAVVELHNTYNRHFMELEQRAKSLSAQLEGLRKEREALIDSYEMSLAQINADIAAFNKRAGEGGFTSTGQFNSQRSVLTVRLAGIEALRNEITVMTTRFNDLVRQHNEAVVQSGELYQSIDSTVAPAPKV